MEPIDANKEPSILKKYIYIFKSVNFVLHHLR